MTTFVDWAIYDTFGYDPVEESQAEWQGPPIYGAVVIDGLTYPEFCNEITRYETDLLKLAVRNRDLIMKVLRATDNHDIADRFATIIELMEGEDSVQFWEAP